MCELVIKIEWLVLSDDDGVLPTRIVLTTEYMGNLNVLGMICLYFCLDL